MQLSLLFLGLMFSVPLFVSTTDFLLNPESLNSTLGSTAQFRCRIVSFSLYWEANISTRLVFIAFTERDGVTSASILSVPASKENNNTKFECVSRIGSKKIISNPAYLKVQGLLDAPANIKAFPLSTIITVSWDPPFTLDITHTEDDLWYTIEIINVTNSSNLTSMAIPCAACPVYEPRYNFTVDRPDPCSRFAFRITAINGAGSGQTSESVYGYFLGAPQSILATDIETIAILHPLGVLELKLMFPITNSCLGEVPDHFKIYFEGRDGNQYVFDHGTGVQETGASGLVSVTFTVRNNSLPFQQTYSVILEARNKAGQAINSSESFDLYSYPSASFDKAEVKVSENGSLCITCEYTPESEVLGCIALVQFRNTSLDYNVSRRYMEASAHGCFTIRTEESKYTVEVYTWESESYIGEYPVYVAQISTVTDITSTTPPATSSTSVPDEFPSKGPKCAISCVIAVATSTVSGLIVACAIIMLIFASRKHCRRRDKSSLKTPENVVEISLKRNISYEQHQLSSRSCPLQPTELEPCPAYGVVIDRQVMNYCTQ